MRSSKSRSRSKNNRNRSPNSSGANVVNRVFDSSGPDGKVRGTPQQIIDKYNQLARDAQLSNDRVAAENFQQHAEHYLRMLSEAQREMDERREQQDRENRDRQAQRDRNDQGGNSNNNQGGSSNNNQGGNSNRGGGQQGNQGDQQPYHGQAQPQDQSSRNPQAQNQQPQNEQPRRSEPRKRFVAQDDVVDLSEGEDDNIIVDTPENAAAAPEAKPKRARKPRAKKTDAEGDGQKPSGDETASAAE